MPRARTACSQHHATRINIGGRKEAVAASNKQCTIGGLIVAKILQCQSAKLLTFSSSLHVSSTTRSLSSGGVSRRPVDVVPSPPAGSELAGGNLALSHSRQMNRRAMKLRKAAALAHKIAKANATPAISTTFAAAEPAS